MLSTFGAVFSLLHSFLSYIHSEHHSAVYWMRGKNTSYKWTVLTRYKNGLGAKDEDGHSSFTLLHVCRHKFYLYYLTAQQQSSERCSHRTFLSLIEFPILPGVGVAPAQVYGFNLSQIAHYTRSVADQRHFQVPKDYGAILLAVCR